MIKSFKSSEAEKLFHREISRRLPPDIQGTVIRKLWMIHAAGNINDLRLPPSNHLEPLKGDRKGQYSIRINRQWRLCFKWFESDAYEVEITDYH
ncbi:MAG: type II toxin-antitoxin system RelE/ParE family toxin [Fibrobacterota bacterium]